MDEGVGQRGAGEGGLKPGAARICGLDSLACPGDRSFGVAASQTRVGKYREVIALPVERVTRVTRLREGFGEALFAGAVVAV